MKPDLIELSKRINYNINLLETDNEAVEKVMDLPDNFCDLDVFEKALALAKEKGATFYSVHPIGQKGFFKFVPIIDVIKADLQTLQDYFNNTET